MSGLGLLVVRSGDRTMAVRVGEVLEVGERGPWQVVPSRLPAMRGVVMVRGRLVPLIHLGSLVGNQAPPVAPGPLMVVAESNGQWVALEVDEVGSAGAPDLIAAEQSGGLPGLSAGALRRDDTWIPVLNLEALARRWQEPAMKV